MKICVEIKNCHSCRHRNHSGAFTPGGAKWICGHPNASDMVTEAKGLHKLTREDFRKINNPKTTQEEKDKLLRSSGGHWKHRRLPHNGNRIPPWCPLKHGKRY